MADQQQPTPLWEVMHDAYMAATDGPGCDANECYAAQIEALADWLVPKEPQPLGYVGDPDDHVAYGIWIGHMEIRQRLLDEARRARGGGQS